MPSLPKPLKFGHNGQPGVNISPDLTPVVKPSKTSKHILIVGGGVIGLTTAWVLLDKGFRVTIISKSWATTEPNQLRLTSQIAGALWEFPPGGCGLMEIEVPVVANADLAKYREWALSSFEFYNQMHKLDDGQFADKFGLRIKTLDQFFLKKWPDSVEHKDPSKEKYDAFKEYADTHQDEVKLTAVLKEGTAELTKKLAELGVDSSYGTGIKASYGHRAPMIDTDVAMQYLMNLVEEKGANMETRTVHGDILNSEARLLGDYEADAIVNATGLAARETAADNQVFPVRGGVHRVDNSGRDFKQVNGALLVPAQKDDNDEVNRVVFIVPRNEKTLILGSIIQRNNDELSLSSSSPEMELIRKRCNKLLPALHDAKPIPEYPFAQGLRPFSHQNARVAAETREKSKIVHNYGHGGSGWTLSFGCANSAVQIIEDILGVHGEPMSGIEANSVQSLLFL